LEEYLPIVKEVNQTKENLAKQSNQLGKIKQQLQQMAKKQAADEGNITERKQVIRRQEKEVEPLHEKQLEVMKLREQYKITRDAVEAVEKTTTSHRDLQEAEALYKQVEQSYKEKEKQWLDNQALVLADHLVEGEACPVCGSAHHPDKATTHSQAVSREQLEALKNEVETQLTRVNQARLHQQSNDNDYQKALMQLNEYGLNSTVTKDALRELTSRGK